MLCKKCKAHSITVGAVQNTDNNDIYRKRRCLSCGYTFYTVEKIVKASDRKFKENWDKYGGEDKG